jgi:hypothetical protein
LEEWIDAHLATLQPRFKSIDGGLSLRFQWHGLSNGLQSLVELGQGRRISLRVTARWNAEEDQQD